MEVSGRLVTHPEPAPLTARLDREATAPPARAGDEMAGARLSMRFLSLSLSFSFSLFLSFSLSLFLSFSLSLFLSLSLSFNL